ncbi:MAG: hypothetical protein CME62_09355 [Halobacteriovoraceae bacterium]|nr:hypothetical protein [Halobacteriovoraceae bacterium]|tara:strand:+ start:6669 stop:7880 length:1212 start_codon:yes stop_codon:yes gene_type:complete
MEEQVSLRDTLANQSKVLIKDQRYFIIGKIVHTFGFLVHLSWIFLFYFLEAPLLAIFNIFSALCFFATLKMNQSGKYFPAILIAVIEVIIHQVLAVKLLGVAAGFQYYLITILIVPYLTEPAHNGAKMTLSSFVILIFITLNFYCANIAPIYTINSQILDAFYLFNVTSAMVLIAFIGYYFNKAVTEAEDNLEKEQKKSDELLHNILPHSICERMKNGNKTIADKCSQVSILFLDLVGFTKLSSNKTAEELVDILNEIFTLFDNLAEKYHLEKIKTIGDCYMVAAGVPKERPDDTKNMILFASELNKTLDQYNARTGNDLKMRVGINTGNVVAGIIGKKKFVYDLWGDTVNIASRMESHGEVGRIQVSQNTYELLKNDFEFEPRGPIEIKGKGQMETYFLKND